MSEGTGGRVKDRWLRWLADRLPPCEAITRMSSESLERDLSPGERLKMRIHFRICVWCARYFEQVRTMRGAVRRHAAEVPDRDAAPGLSPEARERLRRALAARSSGSDT